MELERLVELTAATAHAAAASSTIVFGLLQGHDLCNRPSLRTVMGVSANSLAPDGDRGDGRRQLAADRVLAERDQVDEQLRNDEHTYLFGE